MRALLFCGLLLVCFGCPRVRAPVPHGEMCQPLTCAAAGAQCGALTDGCGHSIYCGSCPPQLRCGGGGASNRCGTGECTRTTCAEVEAQCGLISDGCDDVLDCGGCPEGQRCANTQQCVPAGG